MPYSAVQLESDLDVTAHSQFLLSRDIGLSPTLSCRGRGKSLGVNPPERVYVPPAGRDVGMSSGRCVLAQRGYPNQLGHNIGSRPTSRSASGT